MTDRLVAAPVFELPVHLRHKGEPTRWARMTRPGQNLHSYLESAFFDDERNLWLVDVPYGRVFRISPAGEWETVHEYDGEPHAIRAASNGTQTALDYRRGLIRFGSSNDFKVLSTGLEDQQFLGLSDMCRSRDGTLWFTDSGRTSLSDPSGRVWRLSAACDLRLVLDCVPYSNGICLSPDEQWVYVAATRSNQIWRFSSQLPDSGQPMVGTFLQLSGGLGPDGLATNSHGWLAVAQAQAGRAYVFNALGDPVVEVRVPDGLWTTSVAFHPDNQTCLYIVDAQTGTVFASDISQ